MNGRECKNFWIVVDGDVKFAKGYSCGNPDMWWFPSVGMSMCEKHHVFFSETEAKEKAKAELRAQINVLTLKLEKLQTL